MEKLKQIRREIMIKELNKIKHCTICIHFDIWEETPEDATCIDELIPHHYCKLFCMVLNNRETCDNFKSAEVV